MSQYSFQQQPVYYAPPQKSASGLGIASLVIGILALIGCWFPIGGVLLAVLGLFLGLCGLMQNGQTTAKGTAVAGTILSAVAMIPALIVMIFVGGVIGGVSNAANQGAQQQQQQQNQPTNSGLSPARADSQARKDIVGIRRAIQMYKIGFNSYPPDLATLATTPGINAIIPNDPWGNPYMYIAHPSHYDLTSAGPNGVPGDSDDIQN